MYERTFFFSDLIRGLLIHKLNLYFYFISNSFSFRKIMLHITGVFGERKVNKESWNFKLNTKKEENYITLKKV